MNSIKSQLPSRNTMLFFGTIFGISGAKFYDRWESEKIRKFYQKQAKVLADKPMTIDQLTEKYYVLINAPEESGDALFKSKSYFESYIKPIFDAGAVDYEFVEEKQPGDIQKFLIEEVKRRRREGVDPSQRFHGIVALGQEAYLKALVGIRDGSYTSDISIPAPVEEIKIESKVYESPKTEDENGEKVEKKEEEEEKKPSPPYNLITKLATEEISSPQVPQLPPVGYIRFHNYVGWSMIPLRLFNWFRDRQKVQDVGFDALSIILNRPQPFDSALHTDSLTQLDKRHPQSKVECEEGLNAYDPSIVNQLRVFQLEETNHYQYKQSSD